MKAVIWISISMWLFRPPTTVHDKPCLFYAALQRHLCTHRWPHRSTESVSEHPLPLLSSNCVSTPPCLIDCSFTAILDFQLCQSSSFVLGGCRGCSWASEYNSESARRSPHKNRWDLYGDCRSALGTFTGEIVSVHEGTFPIHEHGAPPHLCRSSPSLSDAQCF